MPPWAPQGAAGPALAGMPNKPTSQPTSRKHLQASRSERRIPRKQSTERIKATGKNKHQGFSSFNDTQSGSIKELTNSGHGNATPYRSTGLVHVASKTKCRETPASKQIRMKDTADVVHREDKGKQKKQAPRIFSFDDIVVRNKSILISTRYFQNVAALTLRF